MTRGCRYFSCRSTRIYCCTGAIAKQTANRAVGIIHDLAQDLCTDNQHVFCLAAAQKAVRHIRCINKAGAGGGEIKCKSMICTDRSLKPAAQRWCKTVRGYRAGNNEINLFRRTSRICQCSLCRRQRNIEYRLIHCDAPLVNACMRNDPFVCRINHLCQHMICQTRFRKEAARSY